MGLGREVSAHERQQLERLIDLTSLRGVVEALHDICREKAQHIYANWQDEALGKDWDRAAVILYKAACGPIAELP